MKDVELKGLVTGLHFKRMTAEDLKNSASFNIVNDGEFVGIFVVPASGEKRSQIQGLCSQMNGALGRE